MAFTLPVFNLTSNVWRPPNAPPAAPTRTVPSQLYFPSRDYLPVTPGSNTVYQPPVYLRMPIGSDVRTGDVIEAAAGDGWYYRVRWTDRVHRGFVNEYYVAVLEQGSSAPSPAVPPYPPPPPPPPPSSSLFYGPASNTSMNLAANALAVVGTPIATAGDKTYCAVLSAAPNGAFQGVTCNAVPAVVILTVAVGPYLGTAGVLYLCEANPGVGAVNWNAQMNGVFTSYLSMICVNLKAAPPATVGLASAPGFSPAAPAIAMAGGEVLAVPTPCMASLGVIQAVGGNFTFTPGFLDFVPSVVNGVGALQSCLNFAGYSNPPAAPLTAMASVPISADAWTAAVFGKH